MWLECAVEDCATACIGKRYDPQRITGANNNRARFASELAD